MLCVHKTDEYGPDPDQGHVAPRGVLIEGDAEHAWNVDMIPGPLFRETAILKEFLTYIHV